MFFVLSGFLITTLLVLEFRRASTIQLGRVLGPPGAPPAPGAVARAGLRRDLHALRGRAVGAQRRAQRHVREPLLRRELALHLRPAGLLPAVLRRVAAAAHVVARDRGAVLPRVAADRARVPAHRPRLDAPARRGCARSARSLSIVVDADCGSIPAIRRPRTTPPTRARTRSSSARSSRCCCSRWRPSAQAARARSRSPPSPRSSSCSSPLRITSGTGARYYHGGSALFAVVVAVLIAGILQAGPGRVGALVAAARVDRADLLRPVPVALADRGVARAVARARRHHDAEPAAPRGHVRGRDRVVLPRRATDPRAHAGARASPRSCSCPTAVVMTGRHHRLRGRRVGAARLHLGLRRPAAVRHAPSDRDPRSRSPPRRRADRSR